VSIKEDQRGSVKLQILTLHERSMYKLKGPSLFVLLQYRIMLNGFGYAMFGVPTSDLETTWKCECTTPPAPGHLPLLFKPLEPTSWSVSVSTSVTVGFTACVMSYPSPMTCMGGHASGIQCISQTHIKNLQLLNTCSLKLLRCHKVQVELRLLYKLYKFYQMIQDDDYE
jgi:hypothetical protein